jgi:anti-sigma factor RsiW
MANCPDENDIVCYIDGLLPNGEVKQLEKHLLGCDRCREIVEVTRKIIKDKRS